MSGFSKPAENSQKLAKGDASDAFLHYRRLTRAHTLEKGNTVTSVTFLQKPAVSPHFLQAIFSTLAGRRR